MILLKSPAINIVDIWCIRSILEQVFSRMIAKSKSRKTHNDCIIMNGRLLSNEVIIMSSSYVS
jgi:hypothetical protein